MLVRAFAIVRAVRHEPSLREVRGILGLAPGQPLGDALPLSQRQCDELRSLFGPSYELIDADQLIYHLLSTMRDADERLAKESRSIPLQPTCLYRFHDDDGRLLYVGVAYDPDAREKQHRHSQRWAPLIHEREDEWFDTREEALRAETHAIRNESPLFNEAGRPRLPSLNGEVFA